MLERVLADGTLAAGERVVAMVSGGRDSVCLLDLAARASGVEAVTALHVNYGLREGADTDQRHCAVLCERLGVELVVERPVRPEGPGNLQAWARDTRYLRYFTEQDVVGHMESGLGADTAEIELGQVTVTLCFIDLTGFTRYTEEEGDLEALDVVEKFVETVEATLPPEATIVKTIGDEVMIVSPDAAALTEWTLELLRRLPERPQPRVGIHYGEAVYRDGDYFGGQVNLAHRVVGRALAGEVLVTDRVSEALRDRGLRCDPIGEVTLRGFPEPTPLFVVRAAE